jgi:hypothetical protein
MTTKNMKAVTFLCNVLRLNGRPQLGHVTAFVLTSRLQSGQGVSGMAG